MQAVRLEVVGPSGVRTVPVDKPVFTIGRRRESDLEITSPGVSRDHAHIVRELDRYVIRDRSSTGTFVNDQPVSEATLAHGDRIRLGSGTEATLVFLTAADDAAAPEAAVHDLRQMAALFQGLRAIGSVHALDEILALVLDLTIEFTGAERGFVMLADADGRLQFTQARAQGRVTLSGRTFATSQRIPEEVFATGQPRTVGDLLEGDLANVHTGTIALGIRRVLCLPLQLTRVVQPSGETVQKRIGVLYLDSRRDGALLSDTTRAGLETLAKEAADAIESARLYSEEIEKHRLEQELTIAAQIQQALLPKGQYVGRGVETAAVSVPCRAIGGDFFEYVELPDGGFGFALGDVAGKGAPAALLTAVVQGVFATRATDGESPAHTITRLNQAVIQRAIRARFVTMIYGKVAPDGRLTYCNAGHNPPLLINAGGVRRLEGGGMVLGLFGDAAYEDMSVELSPGDVIVVFSDGVSESVNPEGDQYEDERIAQCVQTHLTAPPTAMLERLVEDVRAFSAGAAQPDDWTALILTYRGPDAGAA